MQASGNCRAVYGLLALVLQSCAANAAEEQVPTFRTGNRLVEMCASPAGQLDVVHYVIGAVDALDAHWRDLWGAPFFCLPPNVTTIQVGDVLCKFVRDNPAKRHHVGGALVIEAMRSAFPCEKSSSTTGGK